MFSSRPVLSQNISSRPSKNRCPVPSQMFSSRPVPFRNFSSYDVPKVFVLSRPKIFHLIPLSRKTFRPIPSRPGNSLNLTVIHLTSFKIIFAKFLNNNKIFAKNFIFCQSLVLIQVLRCNQLFEIYDKIRIIQFFLKNFDICQAYIRQSINWGTETSFCRKNTCDTALELQRSKFFIYKHLKYVHTSDTQHAYRWHK